MLVEWGACIYGEGGSTRWWWYYMTEEMITKTNRVKETAVDEGFSGNDGEWYFSEE